MKDNSKEVQDVKTYLKELGKEIAATEPISFGVKIKLKEGGHVNVFLTGYIYVSMDIESVLSHKLLTKFNKNV